MYSASKLSRMSGRANAKMRARPEVWRSPAAVPLATMEPMIGGARLLRSASRSMVRNPAARSTKRLSASSTATTREMVAGAGTSLAPIRSIFTDVKTPRFRSRLAASMILAWL